GSAELQAEAEDKSSHRGHGDAQEELVLAPEVDEPERDREADRGGPESDASGQGGLQVPSKQRLLGEGDQEEDGHPGCAVAEDGASMQGDSLEGEMAGRDQKPDQEREQGQAPSKAGREVPDRARSREPVG